MNKVKIFGLVAFCGIGVFVMGLIYQLSIQSLCYQKLIFSYVGNVLFWLMGADVIGKIGKPYSPVKSWLITTALWSFFLVGVNQLLVFLFVDGIFSLLYNCSAGAPFFQVIQTNHLVPHFAIFWGIIVLHHYQEIFKEGGKSAHQDFFLKQNGSLIKISSLDIICIQADNNAIRIHTKRHWFIQYDRLKDWEKKLEPLGFIRVHRSAIINPSYIIEFKSKPSGDGLLVMCQGIRVKVSRTHKHKLAQAVQFAF